MPSYFILFAFFFRVITFIFDVFVLLVIYSEIHSGLSKTV